MPTVHFQLLHPAAKLPTKGHENDACYDLTATSVEVSDTGYIEYGFGFATAIPEGWQALIYPRSSISANTDLILCNSVGIIDASYRGEWKARFSLALRIIDFPRIKPQIPDTALLYEVGDKIAQVQFQRVPTVAFETVSELPASTRGAGGFGSTGH